MIRRLRLAFVVLTAVVLQTTLFTHLRIDGVAPEIGLVCVLAVAYEDGPNAERSGNDYRLTTRPVDRTTKLKLVLASGGGWAARVSPKKL